MKRMTWLAAVLLMLGGGPARADVNYNMVRIACVPEVGFMEIEGNLVHDSSAGMPTDRVRREALARQGYHTPRGLAQTCSLGSVIYAITAEQDEQGPQHCGGDPDVVLTVTRNGKPFLNQVAFGNTCEGTPSIKRLTVNDGSHSWRGAQAALCFQSGGWEAGETCKWYFDESFRKSFPIGQAAVEAVTPRN